MKKRYIALILITLFLLTNFSSATILTMKDINEIKIKKTNDLIENNEIIYVDDDNIAGHWDGTIEHPYQYIQEAINKSSNKDTVYVFNGTYSENTIIHKSINLIGEDKDSTTINGSKLNIQLDTIEIKANNDYINGFSIIENQGYYYQAAIKIISD